MRKAVLPKELEKGLQDPEGFPAFGSKRHHIISNPRMRLLFYKPNETIKAGRSAVGLAPWRWRQVCLSGPRPQGGAGGAGWQLPRHGTLKGLGCYYRRRLAVGRVASMHWFMETASTQ